MSITARYTRHVLQFKIPSGTSRGVLHTKETFFIILAENNEIGIGECGLLRGLSVDDVPDYQEKLKWVCDNIHLGFNQLYLLLAHFPSIQIGLEIAFKSLSSPDSFQIFPSNFLKGGEGIPINGLIWMGDKAFMKKQISEKINQGFRCLKMKIGAIDFNIEIALLKSIRKEFSETDITLRVDANGAFLPTEALDKLKTLSDLHLHSIEQPIQKGQWQEMAFLCEQTPLPIALDEELIGVCDYRKRAQLLDTIQPQFIILKPSFIGGFLGTDHWISSARQRKIGWWITSALESNVGLNAISQYTSTKNSKLPQGLGTGSLYTNNIPSPLTINKGSIYYDINKSWETSCFF